MIPGMVKEIVADDVAKNNLSKLKKRALKNKGMKKEGCNGVIDLDDDDDDDEIDFGVEAEGEDEEEEGGGKGGFKKEDTDWSYSGAKNMKLEEDLYGNGQDTKKRILPGSISGMHNVKSEHGIGQIQGSDLEPPEEADLLARLFVAHQNNPKGSSSSSSGSRYTGYINSHNYNPLVPRPNNVINASMNANANSGISHPHPHAHAHAHLQHNGHSAMNIPNSAYSSSGYASKVTTDNSATHYLHNNSSGSASSSGDKNSRSNFVILLDDEPDDLSSNNNHNSQQQKEQQMQHRIQQQSAMHLANGHNKPHNSNMLSALRGHPLSGVATIQNDVRQKSQLLSAMELERDSRPIQIIDLIGDDDSDNDFVYSKPSFKPVRKHPVKEDSSNTDQKEHSEECSSLAEGTDLPVISKNTADNGQNTQSTGATIDASVHEKVSTNVSQSSGAKKSTCEDEIEIQSGTRRILGTSHLTDCSLKDMASQHRLSHKNGNDNNNTSALSLTSETGDAIVEMSRSSAPQSAALNKHTSSGDGTYRTNINLDLSRDSAQVMSSSTVGTVGNGGEISNGGSGRKAVRSPIIDHDSVPLGILDLSSYPSSSLSSSSSSSSSSYPRYTSCDISVGESIVPSFSLQNTARNTDTARDASDDALALQCVLEKLDAQEPIAFSRPKMGVDNDVLKTLARSSMFSGIKKSPPK